MAAGEQGVLPDVTINQDSLALLLTSVTFESISDDTDQDPSSTADEDPDDAYLARTFVPISICQQTEQETIKQLVQERQSDGLPTPPPTVM